MQPRDTTADDDDDDVSNHIKNRLNVRKETKYIIGAFQAVYKSGVPEAEILPATTAKTGATERRVRDALDQLERMGDIYQSEDGWKVTDA